MKITYSKPVTVDIKPGDEVELRVDNDFRVLLEFTKVRRITEKEGLLLGSIYQQYLETV